ncbi:MAG TPA: AarF/UbiB family protein [Acidimicrobiales bacterium]|nr:AarF/UbiB family protein [Acidimicrobiales bacterium]
MAIKARHLVKYKDIGLLLVKHARASADHRNDVPASVTRPDELQADAERLATQLEEMGPTFVKLGQLLSTRADLLPPEYLTALGRLQDDVAPISFAEIESTVTEELGVRISNAFRVFESDPLAAASLGQVHRAELRDGRQVVVKVQRPHIREQIIDDMDAIEAMADFADKHTDIGRRYGFADMVVEFRRSLMNELDYRLEADNLRTLGANLADHPRIVVPQPVTDFSTAVVLTMDFVGGKNLAKLGPLGLMDLDGAPLAEALFAAYLEQILVHGFFHADPHPGNVLATDDGRLALLDLGMVARIAPDVQDHLLKLLLAVSEGDGRGVAQITVELGRKLDDFDRESFERRAAELVLRNQGSTLGDLQAGAVIGELTRVAGECGLRLPPELTMLGKALLNLDEVARILDSDFDPNAAIERQSANLMRGQFLRAASPSNVMHVAMEAKEFAERFPGRINKVLDSLSEGSFTLNIQGIDEENIMRGVQKLANRVTAGIIVAAMVIGAALIMRIETDATLFGYPALAIVLFLMAATAGVWILVNIWRSDLPQRKR